MKIKNKRWMRFVCMLLVMALLSESALGSGNIVLASVLKNSLETENERNQEDSADTDDNVSETDLSAAEEEYVTEDLSVLFEMEEKRAQSMKHYRLSDGSIMDADYGTDIHYQKDGQWEDIDNRFVYEAADDADSMEGFATAEGSV